MAREEGVGGVHEVRSLEHLESIVEACGSTVIAIAFYSRSCGACQRMMARFEVLCREAAQERACVRFLKHDVRTEFDEPSPLARLYRVRATPCFAFLVGGAKVTEVRMRDTRAMAGSSETIQGHLATAEGRLAATLRQLLFRAAPSARR